MYLTIWNQFLSRKPTIVSNYIEHIFEIANNKQNNFAYQEMQPTFIVEKQKQIFIECYNCYMDLYHKDCLRQKEV